jgi:hypothetical protein
MPEPASYPSSVARTAEDFALAVIADGEHARRKHRYQGGLPGEVHEVHTDYAELEQFKCKNCKQWNQLRPPVRYQQHPTRLGCAACGDVTQVVWHAGT